MKNAYQTLYDPIKPDPALLQRVLREKRRVRPRLRRMVIAAAMVAALAVLIPTLAVATPQIATLMRHIAPGIAQRFTPICMSCEDQGVRMEVVSAAIHGNVAEVYITMTDLTGDRIDETVDLYDSYTIERGFDSSATCQLLHVDRATKTATLLLTISQWGARDVAGDKITFSVREFLSRKKTWRDVEIPLALAEVAPGAARSDAQITGRTGDNREDWPVLQSNLELALPFPEIVISGAGWVNGMLQIQTKSATHLSMDDHGFLYLEHTSGARQDAAFTIYSYDPARGQETGFCDFVFAVPPEQAGEWHVRGGFTITGQKTEGNWSVTFPLEH